MGAAPERKLAHMLYFSAHRQRYDAGQHGDDVEQDRVTARIRLRVSTVDKQCVGLMFSSVTGCKRRP
jgi:hypothetical protein